MTSIRKYSGQLGCRQCFATESKDMNQLVHACSGVRKKLPIGESSHKKERKKKSVLPRTVRRWVWTASCGEFLEGRSLPQLICHCSWRTPFQLAYPFPSVPASRKTDLFLHCFLKITIFYCLFRMACVLETHRPREGNICSCRKNELTGRFSRFQK